MSTVLVDAVTLSRLTSVTETVAVTDQTGRVVGHFVPALDPDMREAMEPQITEEELTRRERQGGGRQLAEILRDLEIRKV